MNRNTLKLAGATALLISAGSLLTLTSSPAQASSHSDAPLIKQDPQTNLTDVYAFIGTKYDDDSVEVLNIVASVRPFSEPGDGLIYDRFAPDARYSLHITNPSTGETITRYDFQFSPVDEGYKNTATILSYGLGTEVGPIQTIGDARQNYTQTYAVTTSNDDTLITEAIVAPPNVGGNTTPLYNNEAGVAQSGAANAKELDEYTKQAIYHGPNNETFFAGPRDDSFYSDIPGIFDLLNVRILDNNGTLADGLGQDGEGVDGFKGFNVLTFGLQIPLDQLPSFDYNDAFFGTQSGVGVYASVSRQQTTIRMSGDDIQSTGEWVQVNRLGNPLFNEALVPIADKDRFNALVPTDDAQFSTYAANPELAALINFVYSTEFETTGRADLEAVFIPDVLRVATTTGPVPLAGQTGFSRFGFVGGDMTGGVSSGWPNGRRMGDDVIDIALTAVASGPSYETITVVGDNIAENDLEFHMVFPYAATPHAGTTNRKDPNPTDFDIADVNNDGEIDFYDISAFIEAFNNAGK
ncbi:MAG: DUF4331 domain-containing protein [Phycisphaerales bacterium]|nr:DUF4331 domain-containing protein [Phycisphaerales bacterium]